MVHAVFNIEVFNTCQMSFWPSYIYKFFLIIVGQFTKMCSAKFPLVIVKASSKNACHKISWLQCANWTRVGLKSWHSSRHFQIPNNSCNFNSATSAWQAQLYANMDFPNKIGWRVIAKVDWNLKHWMHWCECHYAVLRMENMGWTRIFDTWKSIKNQRALPLELDDD